LLPFQQRSLVLKKNSLYAVRKSAGKLSNQPCKGGKSQTAQGKRSATLGIKHKTPHNDSHRVDVVSIETDGIVVAMMFP
jgi:hypothetical protein